VLTRKEYRAFPPAGQIVYKRNACIIERGGYSHDMGTELKVLKPIKKCFKDIIYLINFISKKEASSSKYSTDQPPYFLVIVIRK
jgi:hypothetical protein